MRRILAVCALLGACLGLRAQSWTLEQCISHALENNLTVRQGDLTVRQGEIEVNTAENRRLPGLSASASESFSAGRSLLGNNTYATNTNSTSTSFNIGADVPVFQGFQIRNNIAAARLNLAAATADLEKVKDDIRVAVAQAFVQVLYNQEILDVADNQIGIDSLQVERLTELLRNGKASAAELAQQKASYAQSVYQRTQAANNLRLSLLDLTQLLELPDPDGFSVVRPSAEGLEPRLLESAEDIFAAAVERKASIQAEQKRLDAAQARVDVAKGAFLPSVSLSGGVGTGYYTSSLGSSSSFADQMKNNFSQQLGLSLSIPIFARMGNRNNLRSAELSVRTQELQLESARKSLYKEIQQAWFAARASQDRYYSSAQVVESARESFELVSAKYENGKANITEFNEAKNTLMKAESDLVQARYEQLYQTRLLAFYKGEDLRL
ncbi:MAG: TolC family protein [Bacteroidales bacterium]|nr:TolC family protein [Bacteroidales bacterium]